MYLSPAEENLKRRFHRLWIGIKVFRHSTHEKNLRTQHFGFVFEQIPGQGNDMIIVT